MTVTKSKDGVPAWDGTPATWPEYRRAAYMYEETVKWESRYLCGPRLAAELTGAARTAISNKKRGWLSSQDGVGKLLRCLKETMSEPALPEISNQLKTYFKMLKHRRGESMVAFCVRHREEYARTCKALTRVMREQKSLPSLTSHAWHSGRRQSVSTARPSTGGGSSDLATEETEEHQDDADEAEDAEESTGGEWAWDAEWWWHSWDQGWDWSYQSTVSIAEEDEDDEEDFVEILPDVIKGWLLLEKANLDGMERSLIQSEVKNSFTLNNVEVALRSHFTDEAIKKRDGEVKQAMYEDDDEEPWEEDASFYEDLPSEALAMYQQAKSEEHEAWAQLQQARQTLREARARQHEVRMGRKFYPPFDRRKGQSKGKSVVRDGQPSGSAARGKGGSGPCARCGQDHDRQHCPKKSDDSKSFEAVEQSEFVFGVSELKPPADAFCWTNIEDTNKNVVPGDRVLREGYGVLDGGATKTMASLHAIECLQSKARELQLPGLTKVDLSDRPTFGFGNSERSQCISTCYVHIPTSEKQMSLRVHALDKGSAPILVSVDTLRKMGAIVDFRTDEAIFTTLADQTLVQLERSSTGHQLIPLTKDFLKAGAPLAKKVESLRQLVGLAE